MYLYQYLYLYFGSVFVIFESRFSVSWDFVVAAPPAGGGWQAQGSRRVKSRARNKAASTVHNCIRKVGFKITEN